MLLTCSKLYVCTADFEETFENSQRCHQVVQSVNTSRTWKSKRNNFKVAVMYKRVSELSVDGV